MSAFEIWKAGSIHKGTVNPVAVAMLKAAWDGCAAEAERLCLKRAHIDSGGDGAERVSALNCADDIADLKTVRR